MFQSPARESIRIEYCHGFIVKAVKWSFHDYDFDIHASAAFRCAISCFIQKIGILHMPVKDDYFFEAVAKKLAQNVFNLMNQCDAGHGSCSDEALSAAALWSGIGAIGNRSSHDHIRILSNLRT